MNNIEEGQKLLLDFKKLKKAASNYENILPVVVQDAISMQVLILAYVSESALEETIKTGIATFWSTSRNELWIKGDTSGQVLDVVEIRVNCEQNSLLFLVKVRNDGACHTKNEKGKYRFTCYYRSIKDGSLHFIKEYK
ncbi:MAG: phosphoribosyl-AMP cyclohydrolase [Spirochaetia bacterium]|nr:phosphoribosyl-AMP cyclohydrolase [Spirochaetia bacterium]